MNKHEFNHRCPKCTGTPVQALSKLKFCNGGCWDGLTQGMDGTEHLHWECNCGYEWLTLCADKPQTDARL
jgi:hypothetical protein